MQLRNTRNTRKADTRILPSAYFAYFAVRMLLVKNPLPGVSSVSRFNIISRLAVSRTVLWKLLPCGSRSRRSSHPVRPVSGSLQGFVSIRKRFGMKARSPSYDAAGSDFATR